MLIDWKWVSVLALATMVSACGGGGDATARRAIAYAPASGNGAIVVNYPSQQEAKQRRGIAVRCQWLCPGA